MEQLYQKNLSDKNIEKLWKYLFSESTSDYIEETQAQQYAESLLKHLGIEENTEEIKRVFLSNWKEEGAYSLPILKRILKPPPYFRPNAENVTPKKWDESRQDWVPYTLDSRTEFSNFKPLKQLKAVTFNTWFSTIHFAVRYNALLHTIKSLDPDLVCLQEVKPEGLLPRILNDPFIRANYFVSDSTGKTLGTYGNMILSKLPCHSLTIHPYPTTRQGRKCLVFDTTLLFSSGETVFELPCLISTVHLESLPPNTAKREEQFHVTEDLLSTSRQSLLLGDFNLCSNWPENSIVRNSPMVDMWADINSTPGFSENTEQNQMLLEKEGRKKQVRYDRVLYRNNACDKFATLKPTHIELIGTTPITQEMFTPFITGFTEEKWKASRVSSLPFVENREVFISDHFGLFATFEVEPPPMSD